MDYLQGKGFVFLSRDTIEREVPWLTPDDYTISTFEDAPILLPGLELQPTSLPEPKLAVVTSDKALYRQDDDKVHLFVYDPLAAGLQTQLWVRQASTVVRKLTVGFDRYGAGAAVLAGLPAGRYSVGWEWDERGGCNFEVAGYQLAPLVASLEQLQRHQNLVDLELQVESFGQPVEGGMWVELVEAGRPVRRGYAVARDGCLRVRLELDGEGPYSLNLQRASEGSQTATVPLVGSTRREREETILSTLGGIWSGSLMPGQDSHCVRGLYLRELGRAEEAFCLERVDGRRVRLIAQTAARQLRVVVLDPLAVPGGEPGPQPDLSQAWRLAGEQRWKAALEALRGHFHPAAAALEARCRLARGDRDGAQAAVRRALRGGYRRRDLEDLSQCLWVGQRSMLVKSVQAGQVIELEVPAPMGVVALGAFLDDGPWEGWATTLAPPAAQADLTLPHHCQAGETMTIELDRPADSRLYVVVKDLRLGSESHPEARLGGRILDYARLLGSQTRTGSVRPQQTCAFGGFSPAHTEQALESLAGEGVISRAQLREIRQRMQWAGLSLFEAASQAGLEWGRLAAHLCGLEYLETIEPDSEMAQLLPEHLARRYRVFPLSHSDNLLRVAMVDPRDILALDDIRVITGFELEPVVASLEAIHAALDQSYGVTDLVEIEETVKDISALDFGCLEFDDLHEAIALDRLAGPRYLTANVADEPATKAEVLFAGWVEEAQLQLLLPSVPAQFEVQALLVRPDDWSFQRLTFSSTRPVQAHLQLPQFVHPDDQVVGWLAVVAGTGPFRVLLERDGVEVALEHQVVDLGAKLLFPAYPGAYLARVESIPTGLGDLVRGRVELPGQVSGLRRTIAWLGQGESLDRGDDPEIVSLHRLDSIAGPMGRLARATSDYTHLCCEQTAAKILAAAALWSLADGSNRTQYEAVIRAGLEREQRMHRPGMGFALYPECGRHDSFWGPKAALYLRQLSLLDAPELGPLVEQAVAMADDVLRASNLAWPPPSKDPQTTYLQARFGQSTLEALGAARHGFQADGAVAKRLAAAYRAAILLRLGGPSDRAAAMVLAGEVLSQLGEDGRLYSTCDSIAALALMSEMRQATPTGKGEYRLIGEADDPDRLEVLDGDVLVEVTRRFRQDWSELSGSVALEAVLSTARPAVGQALELELSLPAGYIAGDLAHICLPDCLARVSGGGQIRSFSLDFEGRSKVTVSLQAIHPTGGREQRLLVCLRNMFEEERVGLPAPLLVAVAQVQPGEASLTLPLELCRLDLTAEAAAVEGPALRDFVAQLQEEARRRGATSLLLDWSEPGLARLRLRLAGKMVELMQLPEAVADGLASQLAEAGATLTPSALGMIASLEFVSSVSRLEWVRALAQVAAALEGDGSLDLERLHKARPSQPNPKVDQLFAMLAGPEPAADEVRRLMFELVGER
ncbi:MAG: hypothetical protein AB7S38_13005 [Vulcanimicrobiota bacterium]